MPEPARRGGRDRRNGRGDCIRAPRREDRRTQRDADVEHRVVPADPLLRRQLDRGPVDELARVLDHVRLVLRRHKCPLRCARWRPRRHSHLSVRVPPDFLPAERLLFEYAAHSKAILGGARFLNHRPRGHLHFPQHAHSGDGRVWRMPRMRAADRPLRENEKGPRKGDGEPRTTRRPGRRRAARLDALAGETGGSRGGHGPYQVSKPASVFSYVVIF